MNSTARLGTTVALSVALLSACADPSHEVDAEDLRARLAELPGVSQATLAYMEPQLLDSAKLTVRVKMTGNPDVEQVTEVVTTTYAAFAGTHHGEEGDLDVVVGDDVIHLRSFEPDAEVKAVREATAHAVAVLPSGSVRADLNTQEVARAPHVFTRLAVSVDAPGRDSVLEELADLKKEHGDVPNAGWTVQSGGEAGWLVGAEEGFPGTQVLALFDELGTGLPDGATILLHDDYATVQLPGGTSPVTASAVAGRHVALLGGAQEAFYHVESDYELLAAITDGDCFFDSGAVGTRLARDHRDGCSRVSRPGP